MSFLPVCTPGVRDNDLVVVSTYSLFGQTRLFQVGFESVWSDVTYVLADYEWQVILLDCHASD